MNTEIVLHFTGDNLNNPFDNPGQFPIAVSASYDDGQFYDLHVGVEIYGVEIAITDRLSARQRERLENMLLEALQQRAEDEALLREEETAE